MYLDNTKKSIQKIIPFRLRAQGMQLVLITRDVNIRSTFFARLAKVCVLSRVCWLSWLQTL